MPAKGPPRSPGYARLSEPGRTRRGRRPDAPGRSSSSVACSPTSPRSRGSAWRDPTVTSAAGSSSTMRAMPCSTNPSGSAARMLSCATRCWTRASRPARRGRVRTPAWRCCSTAVWSAHAGVEARAQLTLDAVDAQAAALGDLAAARDARGVGRALAPDRIVTRTAALRRRALRRRAAAPHDRGSHAASSCRAEHVDVVAAALVTVQPAIVEAAPDVVASVREAVPIPHHRG